MTIHISKLCWMLQVNFTIAFYQVLSLIYSHQLHWSIFIYYLPTLKIAIMFFCPYPTNHFFVWRSIVRFCDFYLLLVFGNVCTFTFMCVCLSVCINCIPEIPHTQLPPFKNNVSLLLCEISRSNFIQILDMRTSLTYPISTIYKSEHSSHVYHIQ